MCGIKAASIYIAMTTSFQKNVPLMVGGRERLKKKKGSREVTQFAIAAEGRGELARDQTATPPLHNDHGSHGIKLLKFTWTGRDF